jgi:hypothetical protein
MITPHHTILPYHRPCTHPQNLRRAQPQGVRRKSLGEDWQAMGQTPVVFGGAVMTPPHSSTRET